MLGRSVGLEAVGFPVDLFFPRMFVVGAGQAQGVGGVPI